VLLARDLVSPGGVAERLHSLEHAVGERPQHLLLIAVEQLIVLGRGLVHAPKETVSMAPRY
jgi:hypothetical protein